MILTLEYVDNLLKNLSNGNVEVFFNRVADDVKSTVMGTHHLAGVYNSKNDFLKHTFERLSRILKSGVVLKVNHILISDDTAIVEMTSRSTTLSRELWSNSYCWILRFENAMIKEVRAYVASYLIQKLIDEYEQDSLS